MPAAHSAHSGSRTAATGVRPPDGRLADSLELWRDADRTTDTGAVVAGSRVLEAHRGVVEHAKRALVLRYGIDSHQAFAVMVRWARVSHTPVVGIAEGLVSGVGDGGPRTRSRPPALLRWLEEQLRRPTPDRLAPLPPATRVRPVA